MIADTSELYLMTGDNKKILRYELGLEPSKGVIHLRPTSQLATQTFGARLCSQISTKAREYVSCLSKALQ